MKSSIILLLISVLLLASCSENTAPDRNLAQSYYICGILEEGNYIDADHAIKIGKTQEIENAQWDQLTVSDALVTLYEKQGEEITNNVILEWNAEARGYIDTSQIVLIRENLIYRLEVILPQGETMSAETAVPLRISVYGDSLVSDEPAFGDYPADDQWSELQLTSANTDHPVQIGTQNDDEFNLYTEIYCLEEYWEAEYTYPEDENTFPQDEKEYMGSVQQFPRRNISYFMYQPVNGIVNYNCYQSSILFYGRTEVSVYSIDSNFLNYLYSSDGYVAGGIAGGIGVFGSISGKKLYTRVIK